MRCLATAFECLLVELEIQSRAFCMLSTYLPFSSVPAHALLELLEVLGYIQRPKIWVLV